MDRRIIAYWFHFTKTKNIKFTAIAYNSIIYEEGIWANMWGEKEETNQIWINRECEGLNRHRDIKKELNSQQEAPN